jgi:hypothetical protein
MGRRGQVLTYGLSANASRSATPRRGSANHIRQANQMLRRLDKGRATLHSRRELDGANAGINGRVLCPRPNSV